VLVLVLVLVLVVLVVLVVILLVLVLVLRKDAPCAVRCVCPPISPIKSWIAGCGSW
jgi:hypothetical protein